MLVNIPKLVKNFTHHHKTVLNLSLAQVVSRFARSLQYMIFPVIIMSLYNEWIAGLAVAALTVFQIFFADPLGGALSDKIGAKKTMQLSALSMAMSGIIWFIMGTTALSMAISGIFLFLGISLNTIETYILKITPKDEGGVAFGIEGNVSSVAYFLAAISFPFFLPESMHIWLFGLIIISKIILFFSLSFFPDDAELPKEKDENNKKSESFLQTCNPYNTFKHGLHFIRMNDFYPILAIGSSLFEGLFYGTIYFIFPIHFAKMGITGIMEGMELGIYELITMFIAGYAGYLADKYDWKHLHSLGWFFILAGVIAMPFYPGVFGLIIVGLIIALGNNLSYFAADHVLEEHDIDHREDGSFMSLRRMVANIGYAIAPILAGFIYIHYGFQISLWYITVLCGLLAFWMIWQTYQFEEKDL